MQSLLSCCFRLALCLAICRAAHRPEPEPPYGAADPPTPPPAEILALKPSSGPTTGGTVITLFGTHLEPLQSTLSPICRFGESGLSSDGKFSGKASYGIVTCTVPAAYAGYEVAVELSLDGGSVYTTAGHRFRFYHEAFVESASPSSGPAAGGTLVRVTGYNFARTPGLQCAFGWRRVPATMIDFEHLHCSSPPHTANGSMSLSFEHNELRLTIDEHGVDGLAALAGEARLSHGVLALAEQRVVPVDPGPFPPPPPPPPDAFESAAAAAPDSFLGPYWSQGAGADASSTVRSIGGSSSSSSSSSRGEGSSSSTRGVSSRSSLLRRIENDQVLAGCGVLSIASPRDTQAAPRGFSASFEMLLQGEAARGLSFSYGDIQPESGTTMTSTVVSEVGTVTTAAGLGGGLAGEQGLWDEFGVSRGLSVRLLGNPPNHYRPVSIEIILDQRQLATVTLGRGALMRGAWVPVHVRLDPSSRQMVVHHDGVQRLSITLPETFAPGPTWQFAVSGCTGPPPAWNATEGADNSAGYADVSAAMPTAAVLLDHLTITSSTLYDEKDVDLRVSLNAESLSPKSVAYAFHAPPRIFSLSPTSGPAAGLSLVTVSGVHFHGGSDYRCRFGPDIVVYASIVDDISRASFRHGALGALRCRTPRLVAGVPLLVEVSLNGQDFTNSTVTDGAADTIAADASGGYSGGAVSDTGLGVLGWSFMPYGVPLVSVVSPVLGPVLGGTLLEVRGLNFGDGCDYKCRFEPLPNISAAPAGDPHGPPRPRFDSDGDGIGDRIIVRQTPPAKIVTQAYPCAFFLFQYSIHLLTASLQSSSFFCDQGDAASADLLWSPRSGSVTVPATYNPKIQSIECSTPPLALGVHALTVSLNAQSYTSVNLLAANFSARAHPVISALYTLAAGTNATVAGGPSWGGTEVYLVGTGFDLGELSGRAVRCRFGATLKDATVMSDRLVKCALSPEAAGAGSTLAYGPVDFDDGTVFAPLVTSGEAKGVTRQWQHLLSGFGGGYLKLTSAASGTHGAAIFAFPRLYDASGCVPPLGDCKYIVGSSDPTPHPRTFQMTFMLRMGEAIGFSISYGVLAAGADGSLAQLGEWGSGSGLRLRWHMPTATLSLIYAHRLVATTSLPAALIAPNTDVSKAAFKRVEVTYREAPLGLTVIHDSQVLLSNVAIPGWRPQNGWRFGLGARSSRAVTEFLGECAIDDLSLRGALSALSARAIPKA